MPRVFEAGGEAVAEAFLGSSRCLGSHFNAALMQASKHRPVGEPMPCLDLTHRRPCFIFLRHRRRFVVTHLPLLNSDALCAQHPSQGRVGDAKFLSERSHTLACLRAAH
ncbi:hypothetical protein FB385_0260 [Paramicrobacterium agarici]|nr:hypothetical protein FB385_0260 [Microbacterium agarici]